MGKVNTTKGKRSDLLKRVAKLKITVVLLKYIIFLKYEYLILNWYKVVKENILNIFEQELFSIKSLTDHDVDLKTSLLNTFWYIKTWN